MEALEQLKSVLCDPEGNVCISGSDGDRKVISDALEALEQQVDSLVAERAKSAEQYVARLNQIDALTKERDHYKALWMEFEDSEEGQELAAAQAREAKLLKTISDEATAIAFYGDQPPQWMLDLIALPTDDSALMDALDREALRVKREFIKDQQYALKQERERICNLYSPDDTASDFMDKIRGLA